MEYTIHHPPQVRFTYLGVKPKEIGVMLEEKYSVYLSLLFERISRWAFWIYSLHRLGSRPLHAGDCLLDDAGAHS